MKKIFFSVLGLLSLAPSIVHAQGTPFVSDSLKTEISTKSKLGTAGPTEVVGNVINVALGFLAFVALGLILWAGWQWMTAAGNEDKISSAKSTLIAAVIGLLIILASWGVTLYLFGALGTATGAVAGA